MRITPLNPSIGAVIEAVDLRASINDDDLQRLREAFLQHQVLLFPRQDLDVSQLLEFSGWFGTVAEPHPLLPAHPDDNRVAIILNDADHPPQNEIWHTDVSWSVTPPLGSVMLSRELPPAGGDTMWISMTAVYDSLEPALQKKLARLHAVHSIAAFAGGNHDSKDGSRVRDSIARHPPVEHPVIRSHPQTGRRALFVNRCFTTHITELDADESSTLLEDLYARIEQSPARLQHRWEADTVVIWDNRCTQHQALGDYFPARRVMHRVTIEGDRPFLAAG